mgnify:CR=1 FL=1
MPRPRGRRRREKTVEKVTAEEEKGMDLYREAAPAKVVELVARTGVRGEVTQIRSKVLAGRDKGKVLRRNVKGPVKEGDTIMIKNTEMEASPLGRRGRR